MAIEDDILASVNALHPKVDAIMVAVGIPPVEPPVDPPVVPVNRTPPSIPNTAQVGVPITGTPGVWDGSPTLAYSWVADETVPGATSLTFTPRDGDAGKTLTMVEMPADSAGVSYTPVRSNDAIIQAAGTPVEPPVEPPVDPPVDTGAIKNTAAVGSIAAGSNKFKLAAKSLFAVNDPVIVEVGGESGQGYRDTDGVGGNYPATTPDPYLYYTNTKNPKALFGCKIDAISGDGLTLTLSKTATNAANNANIYFDANVGLQAAIQANVILPAGRFASSKELRVSGKRNMTIAGVDQTATEIFSPAGCQSQTIIVEGCDNVRFENFHLRGNARFHGFGVSQGGPGVPTYPGGVHFQSSTNCSAADLLVTDVFQKAVGVDKGENVWADRVAAKGTDGQAIYIQWQFQWADTIGGGTRDCTSEAPIAHGAFEAFSSRDVQHINPHTVNGFMASNSAGACTFDHPVQELTEGCWLNDLSWHIFKFCIDINNNMQRPEYLNLGGKVINPVITQHGYAATVKQDSFKGIVVGPDCNNWQIKGGTYTAPGISPTTGNQGPLGLDTEGITFVENFKVIVSPAGPSGQANIRVRQGNTRGLSVTGSTNGPQISTPSNPVEFPEDF